MTNTKLLDCDLHSSTPGYAKRFSGPSGEWLLQRQNELITKFLNNYSFQTALDVGGGHAQVMPTLLGVIREVTLLASSTNACGAAKDLIDSNQIKVLYANLLDFSKNHSGYQLVTCFRIISHSEEWKKLISELCRSSGSIVLIDYPTLRSSNIFYFISFFLKRRIEGNTREFISFWDSEIEAEFAKYGFRRVYREAQFVMPMGIHRALKNPKISQIIENIINIMGLRNLIGSPVIAAFRREGY